MWVSGQEEINGHVFTYVKGENLDEEVLAGVTSYDTGAQFFSEGLGYDISDNVEGSRYGENLEEVEAYPVDQERVQEIALGVRNDELPLSDEEVRKVLGGMTDSEKAKAKLDFFY